MSRKGKPKCPICSTMGKGTFVFKKMGMLCRTMPPYDKMGVYFIFPCDCRMTLAEKEEIWAYGKARQRWGRADSDLSVFIKRGHSAKTKHVFLAVFTNKFYRMHGDPTIYLRSHPMPFGGE